MRGRRPALFERDGARQQQRVLDRDRGVAVGEREVQRVLQAERRQRDVVDAARGRAPGSTSIEVAWLNEVAALLNVSVTATVLPPSGAPAQTVTATDWPPTGNVSCEHREAGCGERGGDARGKEREDRDEGAHVRANVFDGSAVAHP